MLCEGILWQIVMVREMSNLGLRTYNNANHMLGLQVLKKGKIASRSNKSSKNRKNG